MDIEELYKKAKEASENSYSPYSRFRVGAALLSSDEEIFTGTNVENRSFGLTICAERSALVSAVARGKTRFKALFVYCPDAESPVSPCGACRQVISEFVPEDFPVIFRDKNGKTVKTTMGELFPYDSLHDLANRDSM